MPKFFQFICAQTGAQQVKLFAIGKGQHSQGGIILVVVCSLSQKDGEVGWTSLTSESQNIKS